MTEPRWLEIARAELGVKETPGPGDNPRVVAYHAETSLHSKDDETPWCSAFANWCMAQAGLKGTGSAAARSWLTWGKQCDPKPGAVTVLWRGKPGAQTGHVGFFIKADASFVWLLGGNQGDAVTVQPFPRHRVLAYRWPAEETP